MSRRVQKLFVALVVLCVIAAAVGSWVNVSMQVQRNGWGVGSEREPLVGTFPLEGITYTIPTPHQAGETFDEWMARHNQRLETAKESLK